MPVERPRIGVLGLATSGFYESVWEAGGRPVGLEAPGAYPMGGVGLQREWVADWAETFFSAAGLDALLVSLWRSAEQLAGFLLAALRMDLPTVVAPVSDRPFDVVPYALGLVPIGGDSAGVAVRVARSGEPRPSQLLNSFLLANALRAGLAAGGGAELIVHLAALAREAGVNGFPQMIRVLVPESPEVASPDSSWFEAHGVAGLFARLGDDLHDAPTVAGRLKENLPDPPPAPEAATGGSRLLFVRGRASGTEAVCRTSGAVTEVAGECRFFASEEAAVWAVEDGEVGPGSLLVVAGCGPRGGPGLLKLDALGGALRAAGLAESVPVLTDGLAPEGASGLWVSLFAPEAASGGVIGLLKDGDALRFDLAGGRIRTSIAAGELEGREPFAKPKDSGFGYAARYVRAALPGLEGAGFG